MKSFNDLTLSKNLQRAIGALGFTNPTEIQTGTIPSALEGKDVIGCAQTGSGKTAAYMIPTIEKLLKTPHSQAIVLAPTRELAAQIEDVARKLTQFSKHLESVLVVGGASIRGQQQRLNRRPAVIIATPGRLNDFIENTNLDLSKVQTLVLDEADRMLDMGFAPQVDQILRVLPRERQTLMFSATLPRPIMKLVEKYMKSPKRVDVAKTHKSAPKIKETHLTIDGGEKADKILHLLRSRKDTAIVFARTKRRTDKLAQFLSKNGIGVAAIHGGRTQSQRNAALKGFRDQQYPVLVATDVAARGLDIPQIGLVVNFDLPETREDYIHRIGRTGRAGAEGEALNFVTPQERRNWQSMLKHA